MVGKGETSALAGEPGREPKALLGRYALYDEFARGGMASVHFGRLAGARGFGRIVAIKRMHKHLAKDPTFATMFIDEALLAARIQHANVVPVLDVVAIDDEIFLVMEYVRGESLAFLRREAHRLAIRIPPRICCAIMVGVLQGLHAAHEATSPRGEPLNLVHRDVSPHNVLVSTDGVPKVFDFGVAKAAGRMQDTTVNVVKGKCAYLAPEQLLGGQVTRKVDVFAAATVFWELLTGRRLFLGETPGATVANVLSDEIPKTLPADVPDGIRRAIYRGLSHAPEKRFATALEFAEVIEQACSLTPTREVGMWVEHLAGDRIRHRAEYIAMIESLEFSEDDHPLGASTHPSRVSCTREANTASGVAREPSEPNSSAKTAAGVLQPSRRRLPMLAGGLVGIAILGVGTIVAFQWSSPRDLETDVSAATHSVQPTAPTDEDTRADPSDKAPLPPTEPAPTASTTETASRDTHPSPPKPVQQGKPIRRNQPPPKASTSSARSQPSSEPPPVDDLYSRD